MNNALATAVAVSVDTLKVNLLRTLLSTLGVIIGVASLVAVLSLADGMERTMRTEIERTTDVQTVSIAPRTSEIIDGTTYPVHDYPVFLAVDAVAAAREIEKVKTGSISVGGRSIVDYPRTGKRRMSGVTAALAGYDTFSKLRLAQGRFFTGVEESRDAAVIVLSHLLAEELAAGRSAESMVGEHVRIAGGPREVIGVLEAYKGERAHSAYLPFSAAARVLEGRSYTPTIELKAARVEDVEAVKRGAEDWLARRYPRFEQRVKVLTQEMRVEQATQGLTIFKLLMAALTGISLIVGGIGIMNVLLASVTERTREIGVRKATGARSRDILLQFLAESVAISGAGSAVGVVLGLAASFGITALIRETSGAIFVQASFTWLSVASAAMSAIAIGLIFGTYPARRAAALSPIDAIRHE